MWGICARVYMEIYNCPFLLGESQCMQLGIADMHCQGEFYLIEEILDELKVAQGSDEQ